LASVLFQMSDNLLRLHQNRGVRQFIAVETSNDLVCASA